MEIDLSLVLDALPAMVWTALPDGRIDFVNRHWSEYIGSGCGENPSLEWQAIVRPEDLSEVLAGWRSILASREHGQLEGRIRRFDGVYRRCVIQINPMHDAAGRFIKWCGVSRDVEDCRRAEEALRRRELDFQSIVDGIPAPVAVTTPSGEVEGLNRLTLDYFGKSFDELKGWKSSDVVHPDDLEHTVAAQMDAHQRGQPYDVESRHRRADGIYRWYNVCGFPLRDDQGVILRWFHLLIDIDDRKRAEVALAASEAHLKRIIDTTPGLIWSVLPDGRNEWVNQHYLDYVGMSLEQLQGWGWSTVIHADDLHRIVNAMEATIGSHTSGWAEARLRRHDGVYRWFLFQANPLFDEAGNVVKWYGINTDIEARKQAEDAVAASERNLNEIINTIPALVWSARTDGSAEFFNQHYLDYVGLPVAQARDWGWSVAVHPDDLDGLVAVWQGAMDRGEPAVSEVRLRRRDGEYRWFLFRAHPLRDKKGRVVRWYGVNAEIDDNKRIEAKLRRSEAFLSEGQSLARMGNFSWNLETGDIVWSEALYHIFEFESGKPVTLDLIASRFSPDDVGAIEDMLARARRGESDFEYLHRLLMPDQSVKYVHMIAHRATDRPGQIEYIGAALDVTQRRVAEEALDKARSELVHVARIMSLGVLTASIAHEVNQPLSGIVTNAGTCLRLLGADPPDIEGARETARRTIRDGNRANEVITRLRALFRKRCATIEAVDLNDAAGEVIALLRSDFERARVILRTDLADELPLVGGDRVQLQQVIMNLLRNAADAMSSVDDRPRWLSIRTEPDADEMVRLTVRDTGIGFQPGDAERLFEPFYTTKGDGMGIGLAVSRSIIESHRGRMWSRVSTDGPGALFAFSIPVYTEHEASVRASRCLAPTGK